MEALKPSPVEVLLTLNHGNLDGESLGLCADSNRPDPAVCFLMMGTECLYSSSVGVCAIVSRWDCRTSSLRCAVTPWLRRLDNYVWGSKMERCNCCSVLGKYFDV